MTQTRCFLGAIALVLMLSTSASAGDGVAVGADAPDFGTGGQFNSEPVKLSELKGRLVLLELFSTT